MRTNHRRRKPKSGKREGGDRRTFWNSFYSFKAHQVERSRLERRRDRRLVAAGRQDEIPRRRRSIRYDLWWEW